MLKVSRILLAEMAPKDYERELRAFLRAPARQKAFLDLVDTYLAKPKPFPPTWFATNLGYDHRERLERLKSIPGFMTGVKLGLFAQSSEPVLFYATYTVTEKGVELARQLRAGSEV